jgi:endo-1,4-beta-xylanase
MKSGEIQRTEGVFDFELADQFVDFGVKNNMHIVGHTLIWHSQAPRWFFTDENGNDVSREVLIERMKNHIYTVVGRYKGKVHGWDVVNEAIEDNGSWRNSKFIRYLVKSLSNMPSGLLPKPIPMPNSITTTIPWHSKAVGMV